MDITGVTIDTINGVTANTTGTIVAVAGTSSDAYAANSADGGATWTTQTPALPNPPRNPSVVNYLGSNFLTTAGNRATYGAYSASGTGSWNSTGVIDFGTKGSAYGTDKNGNTLFVVTGQNGQGAYTTGLGSAFTPIPQGPTGTGWVGSGNLVYINAAAYGEIEIENETTPIFVFGGGSGRIAYAEEILSDENDIVPWDTAITNPFTSNEFINVIVFGGGNFVAVGGPDTAPGIQGKAAYSEDGQTWIQSTDFPLGKGVAVYALAYGLYTDPKNASVNYFVAGDDNGNIAYSSDGGATWTGPVGVFPGGNPINALAYDSVTQRFIAVGGTSAPMVAYTTP
jgi:hypothetical protein